MVEKPEAYGGECDHGALGLDLNNVPGVGIEDSDSEDSKAKVKHVTLDAMIPREDFAREEDEIVLNLFSDFPISHLDKELPYLKLLRKPDFQRETNHWSPEQLATFIASFVDAEVIPSLILWRSPTFIFIIDGGHRISALRAWINDDYGDGSTSLEFYKGEIPDEQKRIAKRARQLVEKRVGRFSALRSMAANANAPEAIQRRANVLLTRALTLQWIQGALHPQKHLSLKSILKERRWMKRKVCL